MRLSSIGKCVDQPLILNKLEKKMPALLIGAGSAYGIFDTYRSSRHQPRNKKAKIALKNAIIITTTIAASLAGAKGLKTKAINLNVFNKNIHLHSKQIIPALIPSHPLSEILEKQNSAIDKFLNTEKTENKNILRILNKARSKALKPGEIEYLTDNLKNSDAKKILLNDILPEPENLNARGIFSEIGRLSLLGAIPVVGGVLGGIAADKVTSTSSKKSKCFSAILIAFSKRCLPKSFNMFSKKYSYALELIAFLYTFSPSSMHLTALTYICADASFILVFNLISSLAQTKEISPA